MTEAGFSFLARFALALAIWREASGEPLLGKLLVGQTVENRVKDSRWPDTYVGVITQPLQFSAFNRSDPNVVRWPTDDDPSWRDAVAAAEFILAAPSTLSNANHYHARGVWPSWAEGQTPVLEIGKHLFYVL